MKKIGPRVLAAYRGRIINVHPSLLPKYGSKGMFGRAVHEAVLEAGETMTGVTIHFVNEAYDEGRILAQCSVPVQADDTVETLAARVFAREHGLPIETLQAVVAGRIELG